MSMVVIEFFKAVDASLSLKWNPRLIKWILKSLVNSAKAHIISLSLLFFIDVVMMA